MDGESLSLAASLKTHERTDGNGPAVRGHSGTSRRGGGGSKTLNGKIK